MIAAVDFALDYVRRFGWHVFPTRNKEPLTRHGFKDATSDLAIIASWWARWPDAVPAVATGAVSGLVVLDIDVKNGVNGWDSLDALGHSTCPHTPGQHTVNGGYQAFFRHPGFDVPSSNGGLGLGLDRKADRGYVCVPGGPDGRYWDPILHPDLVPLAPMPSWMVATQPAQLAPEARPRPKVRLTRYAEAALDAAVRAIVSAPDGQQRETLNTESFSIGTLAGADGINPALGLESLIWAGEKMATHDARRPWVKSDIEKIVKAAFTDGQQHPRSEVPHGR